MDVNKPSRTNEILSETLKQGANAFSGTGKDAVIKNYSDALINKCWEVFCQYVAKNYQMGKGSYIPKFGAFTFANIEYSLEGTTNQLERDIKPRRPVFLVFPGFVEFLKQGIYTQQGVIQYTQKQNNNISLIKVNFAELAIAVNISKVEYTTILENIIKYIGDKIHKGEFKNKELPGLGVLICRNNIIAVKFNSELSDYAKYVPQKLIQTKKEAQLSMDVVSTQKLGKKPLSNIVPNNLNRTLVSLRPKTSVLTKITPDGENWLKQNLGIDLEELDKEDNDNNDRISVHASVYSSRSVDNRQSKKNWNSSAWLNDAGSKNKVVAVRLEELCLKLQTLEAIYFHKNLIISEMKKRDKNLTGILKKMDVVEIFSKIGVDELTTKVLYDIVNIYSNLSTLDYIKLMASLLKDIRSLSGLNDQLKKSFNGSVRAQTQQTFRSHDAKKNNLSKSQADFGTSSSLRDGKIELKDVQNEIRTIKSIFRLILQNYATSLEQNISQEEFSRILRDISVIYPKEKIYKILTYLDINPNSFSLSELHEKIDRCKIIFNEMTSDDIITSTNTIKDIIFSLKYKEEIFKNKNTITKDEFFKMIQSQGSQLQDAYISAVYNSITKTDRPMKKEEFYETFMKKPGQDFEVRSIRLINERLRKKNFNSDEYYDHLLAYKVHKNENRISNYDFHKAIGKEKFGFSAEEIEALFKILDTKNDNYLDREEWNEKIRSIHEPLFKILDIIKVNELEIEDILFRMQIDPKKNEFLDLYKFKTKMKFLDNSLEHNFIHSLFLKLKNENGLVETKTIQKEFNVFKKENFRELNTESFRTNFLTFIRSNTNFYAFKQKCESIDSYNNGLLSKVDFCNVVNKCIPTNEYKDEDIMKFIRITSLFKDNKVKYPEFLDLIFFDSKADGFNEIINVIYSELQKAKNDYTNLFQVINISKYPDFVDINTMYNFLKTKLEKVNKNTVCKLDLDQDGKISQNDIKNIINRYLATSFFKYENNESDIQLNIYPTEELSEERFKQIVKDIRVAMKAKNLTDVGLFKKLDVNGVGFISHANFNKHLDEILKLAPAIKDQFFNRLDNRKLGMVDQDTFMKLFKEFTNLEVIVKNNWEIENQIFDLMKKFIRDNKHLTDNEIFMGLDYDYDGRISLEDFKKFVLDKLKVSESDANKYKLERVLQQISLTKDTNLTIFDIKEFVNKIKVTSDFDLKQNNTERLTKTTMNLQNDKNDEWIEAALERLGLYISSKWANLSDFFAEYSNRTVTIKVQDFIKFTKDNFHCFEGFNFSEDEIIVIYTAIDAHKKSFITLEDIENKIGMYNFYKKMHHDVKNFVKFSFKTGIEAFKYFAQDNSSNLATLKDSAKFNSFSLTKKEFFDGVNNLFPKKYTTNQVLSYMAKFLRDPERIEFSEFNYLFYDKAQKNDILSSRSVRLSQGARPRAASAHDQLATPYDKDPLEKVKRLLRASKFDMSSFFKMYDIISNGWLNHSEFSNMLKKMNLGLSILEIEKIMSRVSRNPEGLLNLREFISYMKNTDPNVKQLEVNISKFLGELKHMVYKYFANPRLAFQFNDSNNVNEMNFDKFKAIVTKLFQKESKPTPNFSSIKGAFEFIDVRKDNKIDINEWLRTFSYQESSLDVNYQSKANHNVIKELREWENSKEVSNIYALINRNRKVIREEAKKCIINKNIINSENLINVLSSVLPNAKMSKTQWKILVAIADREKNGLIDFELFLDLANNSAKLVASHPIFQF